jgi:glucosylceramidase
MFRSAALAGAGVIALIAPVPAFGHAPRPITAHVWVSTPDGTQLLADRGAVAFGGATTTVPTVVVDPGRRFQTMTGFGASITDSSAAVLYGLPGNARDAAMTSLFSPSRGDGIDFVRQPVGASDFTDEPPYTYDDVPAGQTDYGLRHFSIAHDRAQILPLLRQAERLNPHLTVMATPWSPPAWMKTGGSLIGGRLVDKPGIYRAYAAYLVKFVLAYRAEGVRVDLLSVQNEPQNVTPSIPGTDMGSAQEAKVIEQLGPMLRAAGLHTRILGYDHNWTEHPGDVGNTPPDETADIDHYPQNLLASAAARWISGTAYHCYSGDPSAMTVLHDEFPAKDIYFTECSGSRSGDPADTFSDTLKWHARNLIIGNTRNWAKSVVNWNLALDPAGGPHYNGCTGCTGVLTVAPDGTVTRNAEYFTLGHVARFVQPGARRVASTSFGTTGWNGQVMDVAFVNPDGSTVLVAHNENDDPQTFAVREGDHAFSYTLPGGAVATFVWNGRSVGPRPIDPAGWSATADPAPATGDVPADAVDDDASTRFSTGTGQQPGQYLQVDLGRVRPVGDVVFDTGVSTGDYPRGYAVTVSADGTHWSTAVGHGAGSGQLTTVDLRGRFVRYVRITLTAAAPGWWSVADVRAYMR